MKPDALIVIDMLGDFFARGPLATQRASLVAAINELTDAFRAHGQPVIWVRQEFAPDLSDASLFMKQHDIRITIAGTPGCQLLPELHREPGDHEVVKLRYSAFFGTRLDELLARLAPKTLVVAGINTHACVRTTVIDAYQRDHVVVVADEATSSYDAEHHEVTKRYLDGKLATFRSNAEITRSLAGVLDD